MKIRMGMALGVVALLASRATASPPAGMPGTIVVTIPQATADQLTPFMTSSRYPFTMAAGNYALTWSDAVQCSGGPVPGYIYSFDAHHWLVIVQSDAVDADGGSWVDGGVMFLAEGRTESRGAYLTITGTSVNARYNSSQDFTGETFALAPEGNGSSGNTSGTSGSSSGNGATGGASLPNLGLGGANGAGGGSGGVVGGVAGQVAGVIGGGVGLGGAIFGVVRGFRALKAITGGGK